MSVVIELNDRAFAIARDGKLLEASPSVVRAAAAREGRVGEPMQGRERLVPTEVSTEHWLHLAQQQGTRDIALETLHAELLARLARAQVNAGTAVEVLTAAPFDVRALAPVLALLASAGIEVRAFRDAAVITAAALNLPGDALVMELGLHHTAVTRVSRNATQFRRNGQRLSQQHGGLIELQQQWLVLAAQALVLRTRFDPLHEARSEQALYAALPAALTNAATEGRTVLRIAGPAGAELQVELTRDQLALPVQPFMRTNLNLLHSMRPAGASLSLVLPKALLQLPGTDGLLAEFSGCELLAIPDGFAAMALSAALSRGTLAGGAPAADGAVPLLRRLEQAMPFDAVPVPRSRIGVSTPTAAPTHLLHAGTALVLGQAPLEIGRAAGGDHPLMLPEGLAGVSRRHCTIYRDGTHVVVVDHSRYGSFVNGERVAGRAILRAGDVLRVGDPGVALSLIAVGVAATALPVAPVN